MLSVGPRCQAKKSLHPVVISIAPLATNFSANDMVKILSLRNSLWIMEKARITPTPFLNTRCKPRNRLLELLVSRGLLLRLGCTGLPALDYGRGLHRLGMTLGLLHLGKPLFDRILGCYLFGRMFLQHRRLGMFCSRWRWCNGTRSRRSRNGRVIVPMGAFDVLLVLAAEGCH
jgi:hypothetical protein